MVAVIFFVFNETEDRTQKSDMSIKMPHRLYFIHIHMKALKGMRSEKISVFFLVFDTKDTNENDRF